jgi:hypothetical protein
VNRVDDRIRAALVACAEQLTTDNLRSPSAPAAQLRSGRRARWLAPVLAAPAVIAVALGVTAAVTFTAPHHAQPATSPAPVVVTTTPSPRASDRSKTSAVASPKPTLSTPFGLGYQPMWPFPDLSAATSWQTSYRQGGHQPWHLDAAQTALSFTQGFLALEQIDTVTSHRSGADGAHVGVGFRDPNGQLHTAAVLHLVRFGTDPDAPWEVVGSDDTAFSLDRPAYGVRVTAPLTAGGRIIGVDENIRVVVRQQSSSAPIGQACCTPAGGHNQPWSAVVPFAGATDAVLTIVATTGGHLQQIERFAIQGVRS